MRTTRRARRAAFTLLEVVLAVGLTVVLAGSVYAFYQVTLGVREDLRQEGQRIFAARRALDLMARELESAVFYPTLQTGLRGDSQSVHLMRTVVPSRAVFVLPASSNAPYGVGDELQAAADAWEPEHDVQMVSYRLNRYEDEDGYERIGGLERSRMRTVAAQTAEEGSNVRVVLVTERVKFLRLQYWDGLAWQDSWQQGGLPLAVRIDLGAEPLPEETAPEDYPYETIWRIVAVPTGQPPAEGTSVRLRGGRAGGAPEPGG